MKKRMAFFAALLVVVSAYVSGRAQEERDWDWVNQHFQSSLDEFLPLEKDAVLAFRSYRDLYTDVLEYSVSFLQTRQGKLEVVVRMPIDVSVYDQLMRFHLENPGEDISSIKKKLRVKEWRLTEESCPLAEYWFSEYEKLLLPTPTQRDIIFLHPTVYTFHLSDSRTDMEIKVYGNEHPLTVWAENTRRALSACTIDATGLVGPPGFEPGTNGL